MSKPNVLFEYMRNLSNEKLIVSAFSVGIAIVVGAFSVGTWYSNQCSVNSNVVELTATVKEIKKEQTKMNSSLEIITFYIKDKGGVPDGFVFRQDTAKIVIADNRIPRQRKQSKRICNDGYSFDMEDVEDRILGE